MCRNTRGRLTDRRWLGCPLPVWGPGSYCPTSAWCSRRTVARTSDKSHCLTTEAPADIQKRSGTGTKKTPKKTDIWDVKIPNLFSLCVHVPHRYSSIGWAGQQLPGQLKVAQSLKALTGGQRATEGEGLKQEQVWDLSSAATTLAVSHLLLRSQWHRKKINTHWCPCSSNVRPFLPPMSHMMMLWSEAPENSSLWTGSHHRVPILPEQQIEKLRLIDPVMIRPLGSL